MQAPQAGPSAPQAGASTPSGAEADTSKVEPHPVSRLPPQYFQPPDAFDAVHHMLESLPEQLSEAYVQGQIQQTQLVLDSINSQLSARVMRSYGAFVHGMAQVHRARTLPEPEPELAEPEPAGGRGGGCWRAAAPAPSRGRTRRSRA